MSARSIGEAQAGLLRDLPGRVPVERIERIWLFAPREVSGKESGLVVLALLPPAERAGEQRQVVTWRYEAERVRGRVRRTDEVTEEGWAPADRLPRLIEGVVARLADETENPLATEIGGRSENWTALLESLGIPTVDSSGGE